MDLIGNPLEWFITMKSLTSILLTVLVICTLLGHTLVYAQANTASKGNHPVLVELFTSEGCSSCPSADLAMAELQNEYATSKKPVYFIAYHVDYWNYLGWKDRFSSPAYTERQQAYAQTFNLSSIYTPQSIVNGKAELVGSKKELLRKLIDQELDTPISSHLSLKAHIDKKNNTLQVQYTFDGNPSSSEIQFMLVDKIQHTQVKRGENAGRALAHINVLRQWIHEKASEKGTTTIQIRTGIQISNIRLIAFIQRNSDKRIVVAGEVTGIGD